MEKVVECRNSLEDSLEMPAVRENGEYEWEATRDFLKNHSNRNKEQRLSKEPELFDQIWVEKVEGGGIVWSSGQCKSDTQFDRTGTLFGIWVNEESCDDWEKKIKDQYDEAKKQLREEMGNSLVNPQVRKKNGIVDMHGWGGTGMVTLPDLREKLIQIKKQGGKPEDYYVLSLSTMGSLGTRNTDLDRSQLDIKQVPVQVLSALKNIAIELTPNKEKVMALEMIKKIKLFEGHSMGGYAVSKLAQILEGFRKEVGIDRIQKILGKDAKGKDYLNHDLTDFYEPLCSLVGEVFYPQYVAYNPVVYGNLDKEQLKTMQDLIKERRKKRFKHKDPIHLNENMLVNMWVSEMLPTGTDDVVRMIPALPKRIFEIVVTQMLGEEGSRDAGKWRLWNHMYTAMYERNYLVDCKTMLQKPIMIMENEADRDDFSSLVGEGRYFVSAGDLGVGDERRLQKGDVILQEWIDKFFALAIGLKFYFPTKSHYPVLSMASKVIDVMLEGPRMVGEDYDDYRKRLGTSVSDLSNPMNSIGYSPASLE